MTDPKQNPSAIVHEEVPSRGETVEARPSQRAQNPNEPTQKEHSEVQVVDKSESEETGPEASSSSGGAAADKPGRLARLRRTKKKDMPGGLWLKCESCSQVIYRKELEEKGRVCPACDFHFTLPGTERVNMLLDEGTWKEEFADLAPLDRLKFTEKVSYEAKIEKTLARMSQKEALICGRGEILGRKVVLAVLDFSFMGGSMGEVVGEKIALATEMAASDGRPLLIFTSSGGARMHEGILSLMQMAKTCAALDRLNQVNGFSICVMTHPTTGGVTASFATVCDISLAEPGALIGFAGPRVIATTIKQDLPPGFQRAEFMLDKGMIDAIVRRTELRETLAKLIDYRGL